MSERNHNILILDDELSSCKLVRKILSEEGMAVGYALDEEQFLTRLEESWDLILLDLNMPGTSGLKVLDRLKKEDPNSPPVIILTGDDNEIQLQACFRAGAVDYITKPVVPTTLIARVNNSISHFAEMNGHRRKVQDIMDDFSRFVPKNLLQPIYEGKFNTGDLFAQDCTIFFGDIRSYTTLSEELGPEKTGQMLDRLYRIMEKAIVTHNGVVNEFIGDAVMALFATEEGPQNAVLAASKLHRDLDQFNLVEKELGLPVISMGVGIHSGEVLIGALGSQKKVTSTVIGDAVNVASRIEGLTKRFSSKTLISHRIKDALSSPPVHLRHIEHLRVRGRNEPLDLYEVYENDAPHIRKSKDLSRSELTIAIGHYTQGQFPKALESFISCIRANPSDALIFDYIKRCHYFIKYPPKSSAHLDHGEELFIDWNVRRRFMRNPLKVRVSLRSSFKDMGHESFEAEVVNHSLHGISIRFNGYLRKGDTVLLEMDNFDHQSFSNLDLTGRVQWIEEDQQNGTTLVGLETQPLTLEDEKHNKELSYGKVQNTKNEPVHALILDDDVTLCRQLRRQLQEHKMEVSYLTRGEDLFLKLDESPIDILVLDLFMPEVDGFEILRRLRSHKTWSRLPVIVMTAEVDNEALIDRCFNLGANDFITKPPSIKPLLARMCAAMETTTLLDRQDKELEKSNHQLKELLVRSEEDSKNKGMILANMSHELRTPLNGLISTIQLIKDLPHDGEDFKELHSLMERSSHRLVDTVTSLMDYSNLNSKDAKAHQQPFSVQEILSKSEQKILRRYAKKELSYNVDLPLDMPSVVIGDANRLEQVTSVILDNAFKFTQKGSVSLMVQTLKSDTAGLCLRFEVKDTGIGFDEHNAQHLFDGFVQHDQNLTRGYEGSGLGLAIAKRGCEVMGSDIQFSSNIGEGSRFWFDLNFGLIEEQQPKKETHKKTRAPEPLADHQEKRLLLVEDNEDNVELIRILLKHSPWRITVAYNGLEALNRYREEPWDLILMDVHMPQMDGLTATRKIRELEKRDRLYTPIVALTALAQDEDRQRCEDSGMDSYLSKPVKKKVLMEELSRWCT